MRMMTILALGYLAMPITQCLSGIAGALLTIIFYKSGKWQNKAI
ncbi:MAG: hypothetical protein RR776_13040 [Niameybacter sp.]